MDETLAGAGAAPLIAALDSASPDRAAVRASARVSIDWEAVREKLARRTADLEATFAGRGPWADAVLARRAEELAATPQTGDLIDGEAGIGTPMLVARGVETLYGLELRHLGHIVPMPRLARVPGAPPAVLGVIAVAGRVMRLFDLDRLCSGPSLRGAAGSAEADQTGYAIVLRTGAGRPAALRLREVERVADIRAPGAAAPAEAGPLIRAITAERMAILDMTALLDAVKT
ncbi:purine-binding chemotaxis protein CheW [Azospirillum lipoferum]|uniref:Chemotaxis protein CheW n=1 Tax=Azospirillum lipoferum TaxID=193 RepID=A0A5A9GF09_AZOLI|nr:chemotaxis protein CheW [Azospirillum lipoferum]KAA0592405.1 chemotaxis protein CheW [Azospirillum lipoferum]MCP1614558.1 purine-binding chemotaxis protein CheW [Azospirillum lipoferum]